VTPSKLHINFNIDPNSIPFSISLPINQGVCT
jgi:hypothetical protein